MVLEDKIRTTNAYWYYFPLSGAFAIPAFVFEKYYLLIYPAILWSVNAKIWKLSQEDKLFPFVSINLNKEVEKGLSYEKISIVVAILALIVSIIGSIVLPLVNK